MRAHQRRFSLSKAVFNKISRKSLIYNTSWEDPSVDKSVLDIDNNSRILMIAGAGDNVFDYILESPESITAIDQNPYQIALLKIKIEIFRKGDYDLLRSLFMQGYLNPQLMDDLWSIISGIESEEEKQYVYRLFNLFSTGRSFYYRGSAGFVARLIRNKAITGSLEKYIEELFNATDLESQKKIYLEKVEPKLFNKKIVKYLSSDSILSMLGVPQVQLKSIKERYKGGLYEFIKEKLKIVFTEIPVSANYFWQLYFYGGYQGSLPEYLKEENFNSIKERIERVHPIKGNLYETDFSKFDTLNNQKFTHASIMDSLDWFSDNARDNYAFPRLAKNIERNGKILFRSAHFDFESLSNKNKLIANFTNSSNDNVLTSLHRKDRVGTYASLHRATIK